MFHDGAHGLHFALKLCKVNVVPHPGDNLVLWGHLRQIGFNDLDKNSVFIWTFLRQGFLFWFNQFLQDLDYLVIGKLFCIGSCEFPHDYPQGAFPVLILGLHGTHEISLDLLLNGHFSSLSHIAYHIFIDRWMFSWFLTGNPYLVKYVYWIQNRGIIRCFMLCILEDIWACNRSSVYWIFGFFYPRTLESLNPWTLDLNTCAFW